MIGMYWDTSTEWIVVEVFEFSSESNSTNVDVLYSYKGFRPKEASTQLVVEIQKGIQDSGIQKPDWIFVANGPGSFTGIRLAVATGRNLSQLWRIPCQGIDSMFLYSNYYANQNPNHSVLSILDGKMQKFFTFFQPPLNDSMDKSGSPKISKDETLDLNWEEIEILINQNSPNLVFSHTKIPISHKLFSEDYPSLTGIPLSTYWNPNFLEKSNEIFHYEKLLPKYMRDTYATKPIPKNQKDH